MIAIIKSIIVPVLGILKKIIIIWALLVGASYLILQLGGCSSSIPTRQERIAFADETARKAGFTSTKMNTKPFLLWSYRRATPAAETTQPLIVYIEGDGLLMVRQEGALVPSLDPTPTPPTALQLAALHQQLQPTADIVYLARPCQFLQDPACHLPYWFKKRYNREIVDAYTDALNQLKAGHPNRTFHLIGYSGGATIALLLASQRKDIFEVWAVAGNLNPPVFNAHHRVDAMPEALNPVDVLPHTVALPQRIIVGEDDKISWLGMAESYVKSAQETSPTACIRLDRAVGVGHTKGWLEYWPSALKTPLTCSGARGGN